ncbi:MAG: histidinol-phosphatase HisJ family protein [Clostridiales Family XIII bacterium]|jgi:histidinol-phosphatase (PHP family)|nr:histidinol-phosphatase HisJ family protein [Clostridiales Family XIII bacterium]
MYDYHTHSNFSYDHIGGNSIDELVRAAISAGLDEIAITDHYDPNFPADEAALDFPAYKRQIAIAREKYKDQICVIAGIELGIRPGQTMESCRAEVLSWPYDFVIASVHSAGEHPIHRPSYRAGKTPLEAIRFYYEWVLTCVEEYSDFDVFGHLNVIERYAEGIPDESEYMDCVEAVLAALVAKGKGIEINTSNYRYGQERTIPTLSMLKLYKELGGQIVTTGSDSHGIKFVGRDLDKAEALLKAAGFKYVTTYRARVPSFRPL